MSIEAMKQALEALDSDNPDIQLRAAIILRAAIKQAEKPVAWRWKALVNGEFVSNWVLTHSEPPPYATESMPLYTAPRQEPYDQTSLELCKECGWKAVIPDDGCLVCARQKAKPVAWMYDFLNSDNRDEVIRDWVTQSQEDIKRENGFNVRPLYEAPRQWVGLTDEERAALLEQATYMDEEDCEHLLMLAEAKLKEKNAP
jgi:hypothetical protein